MVPMPFERTFRADFKGHTFFKTERNTVELSQIKVQVKLDDPIVLQLPMAKKK